MAFFLSKGYREQRAKAKENERLKEELENSQYSDWYSGQIQNFIDELKEKDFNPTWGFEAEPYIDTMSGVGGFQQGNVYIFDIPSVEGLAFDMKSRQMLYFTCPSGYYSIYQNPGVKVDFKYVLIPFSDIFKANIEVNSQEVVSTVSSKQNVLGRSIAGAAIAGEAGAVIGGLTSKEISSSKSETLLKKVVFNIQTTYAEYPVISFEFNKLYNVDNCLADKTMVDTMYSIFLKKDKHANFFEMPQNRQCKTKKDYHYYRVNIEPKHDENNPDEYEPIMDYIEKTNDLEIILKRVKKYAMNIQSVIQKCNSEKKKVSDKRDDDLIDKLGKLAVLKERGVITDEEFTKLKSKLMSRI